MHKFPETAVATEGDATEALAELDQKVSVETTCLGLWQLFSLTAATAAEASLWPKARALGVLGDACSMALKVGSISEPFGPRYSGKRERTASLSDLTDADFELIAVLAPKVSNPVFRARLADITWLCSKPRSRQHAFLAIDAYTQELPTETDWFDTLSGWRRANVLCRQLGEAADEKRKLISQRLIRRTLDAIPAGAYALSLARALLELRFPETPDREVADLLVTKAEGIQGEGDFHRAQAYFNLAAEYYGACKEFGLRADAMTSAALTFEKLADQRLAQGPAGAFGAGSFVEDAIQALRKIPREFREERQIDSHIERLQCRLPELGDLTLKGMPVIRTESEDITDLVRRAESFVRGEDLEVALVRLCNIHPGSKRLLTRQRAEESLSQGFIGRMFASTHYGPSGRVIAKTPALDFDEGSSANNEARLWFEMVDTFRFDVDIATRGLIAPALWTITAEHRVSKDHLVALVASSPVIPSARVQALATGLLAGFDFDFHTALYLLAPQLEHLVRLHFKHAGVSTTTLSKSGVENEVGLSSLMENERASEVLGEDLAFEIEALFCSPYGPNIRNEVAHGLLDHLIANSPDAVYAWWLILKLVVRAHLMQKATNQTEASKKWA